MSEALFTHVRGMAMTLSAGEQVALIGDLAAKLQGKFVTPEKKPFRSLRGAINDLRPSPSEEDIDEARREAWASFPRGDLAR